MFVSRSELPPLRLFPVSSLSLPHSFPVSAVSLRTLIVPSPASSASRRPLPLMLGFGPASHIQYVFFSYPCLSVLTRPSSPSTASTTRSQPLLRRRRPVDYSPACLGSPTLPMQG